jgi:hypothetical protein
MTKIRKFNEAITEEIVLTMDDLRSIRNNLGGRNNDPIRNFGWKEDQKLVIPAPSKWEKAEDYNGKSLLVLDLFTEATGNYRYGNHL